MGRPAALRRTVLGPYQPVAFVGSGLSTNFPNWTIFLQMLADTMEHAAGVNYLRQSQDNAFGDMDTMLAIADECASAENTALEEFMTSTFLNKQDREKRPMVFDSLVRAPFAYYVTTNYDTNIEDAYEDQHDEKLDIVTLDTIDSVFSLMSKGRPFLIKLHGCARNKGSFVIGYKQYQRMIYARPTVRAVIEIVLGSRPVVFMGYGHRDPHISSYLDLQKQRLPSKSLKKFTYIKRDPDIPFDIEKYYEERYGIDTVSVEDWSELEVQLDQFAFLHMLDKYERVRRAKFRMFRKFVDHADPRQAWNALLYVTASSELGFTSDVEELWKVVCTDNRHKKSIQRSAALHLTYRTVVGQMLKRTGRTTDAEKEFKEVASLARSRKGLLPPLRALALRYAGIFALQRGGGGESKELLKESSSILEEQYPEEDLDAKKWLAIHKGSIEGDHKEAAHDLYNLAQKAKKRNYLKNGAWCTFNAADEALKYGGRLPGINPKALIREALEAFEELHHLRGQGECRFLLAKLEKQAGHAKMSEMHLNLCQAIATLTGDKRLESRCVQLRDELIGV